MSVNFESSQTKKNLEAAFAGESQATNKYSYYASKAKKEGYEQILPSLPRPPATSASTPSCGSSTCTTAACPTR